MKYITSSSGVKKGSSGLFILLKYRSKTVKDTGHAETSVVVYDGHTFDLYTMFECLYCIYLYVYINVYMNDLRKIKCIILSLLLLLLVSCNNTYYG